MTIVYSFEFKVFCITRSTTTVLVSNQMLLPIWEFHEVQLWDICQWKRPRSVLLSATIGRSPWRTWTAWLVSAAVEDLWFRSWNNSVAGRYEFLWYACPLFSIPSDNGSLKKELRLDISVITTTADSRTMAATSSGLTDLFGSLPVSALHSLHNSRTELSHQSSFVDFWQRKLKKPASKGAWRTGVYVRSTKIAESNHQIWHESESFQEWEGSLQLLLWWRWRSWFELRVTPWKVFLSFFSSFKRWRAILSESIPFSFLNSATIGHDNLEVKSRHHQVCCLLCSCLITSNTITQFKDRSVKCATPPGQIPRFFFCRSCPNRKQGCAVGSLTIRSTPRPAILPTRL